MVGELQRKHAGKESKRTSQRYTAKEGYVPGVSFNVSRKPIFKDSVNMGVEKKISDFSNKRIVILMYVQFPPLLFLVIH